MRYRGVGGYFAAAVVTVLSVILTATGAFGAIGLDAASNGALSSAATSLTFSHTVGSSGTNRLLIVGVSIRNSASNTPTVSSITYAGTNLTLVGREQRGSECTSEIWRLVAPATGFNNVVIFFLFGFA